MASNRCSECGADLQPTASCPLCGASAPAHETQKGRRREQDVAAYQSDVQRLRDQLRRLREDAEAV